MFLVRLVYVSEVTEGFGDDDIKQILEVARIKNSEAGVTGMLCFHRNYFLQCLEGGRKEVNSIYQRILRDNRHSNILLLDYQEIQEREFTNWTMGYMPESSLTSSINMRFSGTPEFTPYEMAGESCHRMMVQLRDSVPIL